ncbi:sirohydrochlorin chelatase [Nonomuraea ferruginea]
MKPPLLLVGQGSNDDADSAEFGRFVHRLRCWLDQTAADVSGGYLERATPLLSESVASLVARGHHRLVALPLTLSRTNGELPAALALEQQRHPTLVYDHGLAGRPRPARARAARRAAQRRRHRDAQAAPAGAGRRPPSAARRRRRRVRRRPAARRAG